MPARSIIRALVAVAVALLVSGCVEFSAPPSVQQVGDAGDLLLHVPVCSGDGACSPVDQDLEARLLVAVELPDELTVPATTSADLPTPVDASDGVGYTATTTLPLERNAFHEAQLTAATPPAAGARWVAYVSPQLRIVDTTSYFGSIWLDLPLDRDDDGTTVDLLEWRVASDFLPEAGPDHGPAAASTTACSTAGCANARYPASGAHEQFVPRVLVARAPTGAIADAGGTERLGFGLQLDGGSLPVPGTVTVTATTDLVGATATPVTSVVEPVNGSTVAAPIDLAVPAGTPDGTVVEVELTATTDAGEVRRTTASVTVSNPPPPQPAPPAPVVEEPVRPTVTTERATPAWVPSARVVRTRIARRCFAVGEPASITFRYELTAATQVTFELHRRHARQPVRSCRVAPEARPRFQVVARRNERNLAGQRALELRRLVDVGRLGVGAYRLVAKTRFPNGVVESRSIQSFVVARQRR